MLSLSVYSSSELTIWEEMDYTVQLFTITPKKHKVCLTVSFVSLMCIM